MNPLLNATSDYELKFPETLRIATAVQLKKNQLKCFYITIKTGVSQFQLVNKIKARGERCHGQSCSSEGKGYIKFSIISVHVT